MLALRSDGEVVYELKVIAIEFSFGEIELVKKEIYYGVYLYGKVRLWIGGLCKLIGQDRCCLGQWSQFP
jgi:hypothetical protein